MMSEMKQGIYTYNDDNLTFEFYTDLPISKKLVFVNSVVDTIVSDDSYNSVIRDLMFDYMVVKVFTDVDMSFIQVKDERGDEITDIDLLEDFLLETNIVDIVKANAFPTLFEELNKAVDKAIEFKTGIHPSPLSEALSNLVSTLERKLDTLDMSKAMEMANKLSGVTEELTTENLVKAYLQADTQKENLGEKPKTKKARKKSTKKTVDEVVEITDKK
jgi:hypothetical protein